MSKTYEIETTKGRLSATRFAGPSGAFRLQLDANEATLDFAQTKALRDRLNELMDKYVMVHWSP